MDTFYQKERAAAQGQQDQSQGRYSQQPQQPQQPVDKAHTLHLTQAPAMISWNEYMNAQDEGGDDTWITDAAIDLMNHVPGVPFKYAEEEIANLALYVCGVPFEISPSAIRDLFMPFGRVVTCASLTSLATQHTFRWVIMKHADDAQEARQALDGSLHESGSLITISRAWKAGQVVFLNGQFNIGSRQAAHKNVEPRVERMGNPSASHRHPSPSPPALVRSVLPPIPRIPSLVVSRLRQSQMGNSLGSSSSSFPELGSRAALPSRSESDQQAKSSSWANVASSSDPSTTVIDLNTQHRNITAGSRLRSVGRIPHVVNTRQEPLIEQMRLVFLLNLPQNLTLTDISNAITEGPLVKIQFGHDEDSQARFCGIIFQFASDADTFVHVLQKERADSRPTRFRFIVDVVRGEAFPADDTIKSMNVLRGTTRRLTIVKGKFFFLFGERQLRDLCYKVVGEENVQLVWLYNGGNATVVFADVESAVKVKAVLDKRVLAAEEDVARQSHQVTMWKGVQTTFSKDPCIHPLELKTAIRE